ncbi:hypothetical protein C0993_009736 [Termitomyces sp. T159_Od127]|nr:hypothetical protein C0993_009736 [Termitomyces sp. T159_Od127]
MDVSLILNTTLDSLGSDVSFATWHILFSAMSEGVLVVIDSASTENIAYGGGSPGSWTTQNGSHWFNDTLASSGTAPGSINITFTDVEILGILGHAIALYGRSPPFEESQMTVTIDEQESYETSFPADYAGIYCQLWQSPTLDEGTHTIQLGGLTSASLDFAAVTVNKSSLKPRQQIIVDDDDASMVYSGNWLRHSPLPSLEGKPASMPFHNGTHMSDTIGASVSFNFTGAYDLFLCMGEYRTELGLYFLGSSIAVYGVMQAETAGSVTARYTLDSNTTTKTHGLPNDPIQSVEGRHNSLLFSTGPFSLGFHTLSIEIEDVQNLTFSFDYVVYTYSLEVLTFTQSVISSATPTSDPTSSSPSEAPPSSTSSSMITLSLSSSSSSSSNATEPTTVTSTPSSPVSQSIPTSESQSTTSSVATPTAAAERSSAINAHTGKIIGLTVGTVAFMAALTAAMIYWNRRRISRRRRHFLPIQTVDYSSNTGTFNYLKTVSRSELLSQIDRQSGRYSLAASFTDSHSAFHSLGARSRLPSRR